MNDSPGGNAVILARAGNDGVGPWQSVHRLLRALFHRTAQAEAEIAALKQAEDRHRAELAAVSARIDNVVLMHATASIRARRDAGGG